MAYPNAELDIEGMPLNGNHCYRIYFDAENECVQLAARAHRSFCCNPAALPAQSRISEWIMEVAAYQTHKGNFVK